MENVTLKLVESQGLQSLIYGTSATSLSVDELKSFSYAYNSIFAKLFKTSSSDVIQACQYYSGHLNFETNYELRRYKFLHTLVSKKKLCSKCIIDNNDLRDLYRIQLKYGITKEDSSLTIKNKMWNYFSRCLISS